MRAQEKAFDIGRAVGKHPLASRLFCFVERALPLQRLARSGRVVAFRHPRPSYDPHILVVPTTPFPALGTPSLTPEQRASLLWEMVQLARPLAVPSAADWQMVINGGTRQDIGQVHGHLIHTRSASTAMPLQLNDPESHPAGWKSLLDRVHQAATVPGNGYSVIFSFQPDEGVAMVFSESLRP